MSTFTLGLSEILVGDVLETGLMPEISAMTKIGKVLENTASVTQEEATFTDFKEQGSAAPAVRVKQDGAFSSTFQIMDADPELLAKYLGGSVVGKVWNYLGKSVNVEKALFIKPNQGLYFQFPKASISATIAGELNNENLVTVTFNVTPLSPGEDKPSVLAGKITDLTPAG